MQKSQIVEEWRAEARLAFARDTHVTLLQERFGSLPEELLQRIHETTDVARLKAALRQVVQIQSLDELHF